MFKTRRHNFTKLFKGAVFLLACVLCLSFFPVNFAQELISLASSQNSTTTPSISVDGAATTVVKGGTYTIKDATYFGGSSTTFTVGETNTGKITASGVTVTYKGTSYTETVTASAESGVYGTFTPSLVGTYVVTYSVTDNGVEYTYDLEVTSTVSEVVFDFAVNDENIIPSVYDLAYLDSLGNGYTDIVLPLPTVTNGEGEELDSLEYVTAKAEAVGTDYVLITLSGADGVIISKHESQGAGDEDYYYIDGDTLADKGAASYVVTYTYYENGSFVASTTQEFDVYTEYYKTKETDGSAGYTLTASFASTKPDSGSIGVEISLPSVSATTSTTNSPASSEVSVYYSIAVYRKVNGSYTEDVTSYLDLSELTFTPPAEGDYKFVYTVKDFYGNEANSADMTFYIYDIVDDVAPTVAMYDASATTTKDADGNYISAKTLLKTKGSAYNAIIYAIGATDNASAEEDIELTRIIRDASGTVRFEISEYNGYNLIFNFTSYSDLVGSSTDLQKKLSAASVDTTSDTAVAAWLKSNKYLIVTTSTTALKTNLGTQSGATFDFATAGYSGLVTDPDANDYDLDAVKNALVSMGYAYISSSYTFSTQTYTIYYVAEDAAGNKMETTYYEMYLVISSSYEDTTAPTITFPTSLQSSYLASDTITFSAPSATDSNGDSYPDMVVAYRYLNSSKEALTSGLTTQTLSFVINTNSIVSGKWYASSDTTITGEGFILPEMDEDSESYSIDLSEIASLTGDAVYIEILVYAEDDFGNIGFYNKVITIAGEGDEETPTLAKVVEADNSAVVQGDKVTLPTLTFTDDFVDYMTASVKVYYLGTDGTSTAKLLTSANLSTYSDSYRGIYVVSGGTFVASYGGEYMVKIIAKDAGGNTITAFFSYTITGTTVSEDPYINVSTSTVSLGVDEAYYLESPTIKISADGYSFIGLEDGDDGYTATYYTVTMVSAENSYYDLTKYNFTGYAAGEFVLQYKVYLIQYTAGTYQTDYTVSLDANGKLVVSYSITDYYVYVDMTDSENPTLAANTSLAGTGEDLTLSGITFADLGISLQSFESENQKIKVSDSVAPVLNIDSSEYTNHETTGSTIQISRISATENSSLGINTSASYVQISVAKSSGSTSVLATIYMDKWDNDRDSSGVKYENGEIYLTLSENGTYTISYTVKDYSGNSDTDSFTISNGDVVKPTITVEDGFLNKDADSYDVGDELSLNVNYLTLSDNKTDYDYLLSTLTITVTNDDTDTTVDADDDDTYSYTLSTAGEYTITISVTDEAGWTYSETVSITVETDSIDAEVVYQVIGIVLLVISVCILVGVIVYFIVSKVKLDKELKKR